MAVPASTLRASCLSNGFRGRVSQVRILPGPLLGSSLSYAAKAAFLCGKPSLYPLSYRPACRGPPGLSDGFDSLFDSLSEGR